MDLSRFIVLLVMACGLSSAADVYNITLSDEDLGKYSNSGFNIIFGDMLRVHCTSDQTTYAVYNLNEEEYNDCRLPVYEENVEIGHCLNSILTISVKSSGGVNGVVNYMIGSSYYFGLFESNGAEATGNAPCKNGFKFILNVTPEPTDPPSIATSTVLHSLTSTVITEAFSSTVHVYPVEPTSTVNVVLSSSIVTPTETLGPTREPTSDPTTEPTRETIETARTTDDVTTNIPTRDPIVDGIHDGTRQIEVSFLLLTTLAIFVFYVFRIL